MKKRIVTAMLALVMGISVIPVNTVKAEAEPVVESVSVLSEADESVGEMIMETRGQYLQKGISSIAEVGLGKISVGGTTIAQRVVDELKVSVMVEKYVDGVWKSYTSWSATAYNTYKVSSDKILTVPRGTYYRVRCIHSANSEGGNSNTSGVYVD